MAIRNPKDGKWLADTARNRNIIRNGQYSPYEVVQQEKAVPYASTPDERFAVYILLVIGGVLLAGWVFVTEVAPILINYSDYPLPYKYVAMFYNYSIVVPLRSVFNLWIWLLNSMASLTSYPGFNLIVGSAGAIIYGLTILFIYNLVLGVVALMFRPLNKGRPSHIAAWILFFMPAIIALVWYLIQR